MPKIFNKFQQDHQQGCQKQMG